MQNKAYAHCGGEHYSSNTVEVHNSEIPFSPLRTWIDRYGRIHAAICGICPYCGEMRCCEIQLQNNCCSQISMQIDCNGMLHALITDVCPCGCSCVNDIIIPLSNTNPLLK